MPENIKSVQPGGGVCYQIELAWGCWRRWYLKTFRRGYVRRMAERMQGSKDGAPHDVLDPRDLKYCANLCTAHWRPADDPFQWRERIPLARWGLAEAQLMGWPLVALTILPAILWPAFWYIGVVPLVVLLWLIYFFRDPHRPLPTGPGLLVAPADGKVVEIVKLAHDEFIGGPAVRIGIFLSIFNVHINRAPCASRVLELRYSKGAFLNALNPESALRNENMWIGLEDAAVPQRRMVVRQIAGAIARRIVCRLRPGELLTAGEKFGMIKLGSRTELILPAEPGLYIDVELGQKIKAGSTIIARFTRV
ncbi:MAG: phosphatidylserine decarboxylase [Planctomycetia bacterium]|nr:phosphatidylserine decarboxylase [Planctomycetia bacterium]